MSTTINKLMLLASLVAVAVATAGCLPSNGW